MSEYQQIQAQIAELQLRANSIRSAERAEAINHIMSLMVTFEIAISELSLDTAILKRSRSTKAVKRTKKIPPKYRDGAGNEWSGRGLTPRWLKAAIANGATAESFLI